MITLERILVVDDEPVVRKLASFMLQRLGYEPVPAADGKEAVALCQANMPFAAALIDLNIKKRHDGVDLLQNLRQIYPGMTGILSSGATYDPVVLNYPQYGFDAALNKPYNLAQLQELLEQVLPKI